MIVVVATAVDVIELIAAAPLADDGRASPGVDTLTCDRGLFADDKRLVEHSPLHVHQSDGSDQEPADGVLLLKGEDGAALGPTRRTREQTFFDVAYHVVDAVRLDTELGDVLDDGGEGVH